MRNTTIESKRHYKRGKQKAHSLGRKRSSTMAGANAIGVGVSDNDVKGIITNPHRKAQWAALTRAGAFTAGCGAKKVAVCSPSSFGIQARHGKRGTLAYSDLT